MSEEGKQKGGGELKSWNPNKHISIEIVLDLLLKHKAAMYKAYYGKDIEDSKEEMEDNKRVLNQVSALREVISSQKLLIDLVGRPIIEENCENWWLKKYKTEEGRKENPFHKQENDLGELLKWRDFLNECLNHLRTADLTPTLEDDFMVVKTSQEGGKENHLTDNFYEMVEDLSESYNKISRLLMKHEITIQKEHQDEDLNYKEQEELFLERFKEA